jgi:hypothetical protein
LIISIYLFNISVAAGIVFLVPGIVFFGWVINFHLKTEKEKLRYQYLCEINNLETDCINGKFAAYPNGETYNNKEHPYTPDLDIFGKASLFQMLNRTNTKPGSDALASWLSAKASFDEILKRQESVKELSNLIDWRQNLRSIFYLNNSTTQDPSFVFDWSSSQSEFLKAKRLSLVLYSSSLLLIAVIVLWFYGLSSAWVSLGVTVSFFINYLYLKKVNKIQNNLSKSFSLLESLSEALRIIENEKFNSQKLLDLQQLLKMDQSASIAIKKLSHLSKRLDYRLNPIVGIPLNLVFFWDIHHCVALVNWKEKNRKKIRDWFSAMSEFEALSSFANLYFNNKDWCFPVVNDNYFSFYIVDAGHPLIHRDKRVVNNFTMDSKGKVALITGSNMSGKSTFLRTCGVNTVLALAGAPVCARRFDISYVQVYSSMRISDSLEENTSSFYAELKKLASIIKVVEKKEKVLLLLDEILRGTNSNDRHTGSVAFIKQLIKNDAPALIATHDLTLSTLINDVPGSIDIYNFDVKIQNEELYFDYKINEGICKSLNASILMKKMGIEL